MSVVEPTVAVTRCVSSEASSRRAALTLVLAFSALTSFGLGLFWGYGEVILQRIPLSEGSRSVLFLNLGIAGLETVLPAVGMWALVGRRGFAPYLTLTFASILVVSWALILGGALVTFPAWSAPSEILLTVEGAFVGAVLFSLAAYFGMTISQVRRFASGSDFTEGRHL